MIPSSDLDKTPEQVPWEVIQINRSSDTEGSWRPCQGMQQLNQNFIPENGNKQNLILQNVQNTIEDQINKK